MLAVKELSIAYGNQPVVERFSLHMKPGEIIGIVGESGSGKTSVIRAIMGLLPGGGCVTSGDIFLQGGSLLAKSEEGMRTLRGRTIAMIFQDSGTTLNPIRRIGSQFVEYIRMHEEVSKSAACAKAVDMLACMRLPDADIIMKRYPFQLSGGMRQRVGIAMAMTFQPKLLLADEPTSALDVTTQAQIVRQMIELRDNYGTGIIIVTHNLGVAAYMCDRILVMKDGMIVDEGNKEVLMRSPKDAYTKRLLAAVPRMAGDMYV